MSELISHQETVAKLPPVLWKFAYGVQWILIVDSLEKGYGMEHNVIIFARCFGILAQQVKASVK